MHSAHGNGATAGPVVQPLTAKQRDDQRQRIIAQLNATTIQVNGLTKAVEAIQKDLARLGLYRYDIRLDEYASPALERLAALEKEQAALAKEQQATQLNAQVFYGASLWRRLRWLVTGR